MFLVSHFLANVFMVELENTLVPRLHQGANKWRCYVDDTLAYVKNFYILSKRFFPKHKELSDARVVSITKKEYGFAVNFLKRVIKCW